jgi:hypothetical protein
MKLVGNWKKLWKSWTVMLATAGIFVPDVLQIIAENIDGIPLIDTGHKSLIRLACLILIVLLRPVKQESLTK